MLEAAKLTREIQGCHSKLLEFILSTFSKFAPLQIRAMNCLVELSMYNKGAFKVDDI